MADNTPTNRKTYEELAQERHDLINELEKANATNVKLTGQIIAKESALRREAAKVDKLKKLVVSLSAYVVEEVIERAN